MPVIIRMIDALTTLVLGVGGCHLYYLRSFGKSCALKKRQDSPPMNLPHQFVGCKGSRPHAALREAPTVPAGLILWIDAWYARSFSTP